MVDAPIEGQLLLLTAAKASVSMDRLKRLVETAATDLDAHRPVYERQYERAVRTDTFDAYFVEPEHWDAIGERLGLTDREIDAVRRAHEEQLGRTGRNLDREREFDRALDIRSVVIIGRDRS